MITRRAVMLSAAGAWKGGACAVVLRASDGSVVRFENETAARWRLAAPGSTVKPVVLEAFRNRGIVACKRPLVIGGRRLDCTHVEVPFPVDAETALAASCNSWFAEMAKIASAELVYETLRRAGAEAAPARDVDRLQLQALGLEGVRFTPLALAGAYRRIAVSGEPVVKRGLERAVREGTAQLASVEGLEIAGKTGTTKEGAWFAGYAPAREARIVVVTHQPGGTGGTDAAPLAREIFEWWRSGTSR